MRCGVGESKLTPGLGELGTGIHQLIPVHERAAGTIGCKLTVQAKKNGELHRGVTEAYHQISLGELRIRVLAWTSTRRTGS